MLMMMMTMMEVDFHSGVPFLEPLQSKYEIVGKNVQVFSGFLQPVCTTINKLLKE